MILEAVCAACGETFVPADESDLEHIERSDGEPCGGMGDIVGAYDPPQVDEVRIIKRGPREGDIVVSNSGRVWYVVARVSQRRRDPLWEVEGVAEPVKGYWNTFRSHELRVVAAADARRYLS